MSRENRAGYRVDVRCGVTFCIFTLEEVQPLTCAQDKWSGVQKRYAGGCVPGWRDVVTSDEVVALLNETFGGHVLCVQQVLVEDVGLHTWHAELRLQLSVTWFIRDSCREADTLDRVISYQ